MKELVEYIAKNLVDNPEAVKVSERRYGRNGVELKLQVAREDMGRVIGRGGRVANAMRTLVRIGAVKRGQRIELEIR